MSNPHPTITANIKGYRQLTQYEQDLINETKELSEKAGELVAKLRSFNDSRGGTLPLGNPDALALDQRWISMGASDLQVGFMKLIRGIAQPTTF